MRSPRFFRHLMFLLFLLSIAGCSTGDGAEVTPTFIPTAIAPEVQEYVVQRGDVVRALEFTGRLRPVNSVALYFEVDDRVYDVFVERDDWVEAGTVLAQLDVEDLLDQLEQAQLALETAQKGYERALALARINMEEVNLRLSSAQVQNPAPSVTIARVNLDRAKAALASAQEEYDKAAARPWDPPAVLEAYGRALQEAQWSDEAAQAQYDLAVQSSRTHSYDVALLQQEVARAELELSWLEEGAAQPLQDVELAQLAVERLWTQIDRGRLVAPFDGQVVSLAIQPGSQVRAFQPVAVVGDPANLEVTAELDDERIRDVVVGMPATVERAGAPGQPILAEVRQLPRTTGPVEDQDPAIHIRLLESGLALSVDDVMRVTITVGGAHGVLWLPPQAIRTFEGRRFVVVRDGTHQRRVDVTIGVEGEERVEIQAGLKEGQVVVSP
ncbi:MAG: HlyD family efflux transporter periplasmic adaptor subunit [Chloroflexota bacterium]|nr:HlyD family efflux transporter periplasmic adaptor subunit [Chloroflexota bacterium]